MINHTDMDTTSTDVVPDDFGGLAEDAPHLINRRSVLGWLGGAGIVALASACASSSTTSASSSTSATSEAATQTASAGASIPNETQGPYPADGSNGPNVLGEADVVRADIRSSIAGLEGTADGVPCTISLTVVDATTGTPLSGAAVYLWHCTAGGKYSIYEETDQNYLRGVQVADDAGKLSFTTIYPGCYRGRWPHAHFEVYESIDTATAGSQAIKTSQIAFPQADCETVYADDRYGDSISNLGELSLDSDNVFSDGWADQLATISGDPSSTMAASLLVRI